MANKAFRSESKRNSLSDLANGLHFGDGETLTEKAIRAD
jgi:hypothetical protein